MANTVIGRAKFIARIEELMKWLPGIAKLLHGDLTDKSGKTVPFKEVSTKASGRKFVIKGFDSDGRHVKFSCDWGQLSDGQVYFIPKGEHKWLPTAENNIDLDLTAKKLVLEFETEFTAEDSIRGLIGAVRGNLFPDMEEKRNFYGNYVID